MRKIHEKNSTKAPNLLGEAKIKEDTKNFTSSKIIFKIF